MLHIYDLYNGWVNVLLVIFYQQWCDRRDEREKYNIDNIMMMMMVGLCPPSEKQRMPNTYRAKNIF